jgi:anti-sigma B factor antagonist
MQDGIAMLDGKGTGGAPAMQGAYRIARPRPRTTVVELLGEHDLATTPHLREVVFSLVRDQDLVVLDLTGVDFIDSSALLMIVQANRLAGEIDGRFRLVIDDRTLISRMLELSKVFDHCDVVSTREVALAASR